MVLASGDGAAFGLEALVRLVQRVENTQLACALSEHALLVEHEGSTKGEDGVLIGNGRVAIDSLGQIYFT